MSQIQKHFKKILSFTVVIVFLVFLASFNNASSSALDNVYGYAWSANNYNNGQALLNPAGGMGWLSFNCISMISDDGFLGTGNDCGNVDYGINLVNITPSGADIVGYAWSPNYGWLKFGGFNPSDFPLAGGSNARVDFTTGSAGARPVSGWARFCSGGPNAFSDTPNCNGATIPNYVNGGWDGWVKLDNMVGANDYGVKLKTNVAAGVPKTFSGYGWGGNDVVGWISFNCSTGGVCATSDYKVSYLLVTAPTVVLQAEPNNVLTGGTTTLSWTGSNIASASCTASTTFNGTTVTGASAGGWSGTFSVPPSSFPTTALAEGDYVFTITCGAATSSVSVHSGIDLVFAPDSTTAFPDTSGIYHGTLRWNSIPYGSVLTGCTATSSQPGTGWGGASGAGAPVSNPPPNPSDVAFFQSVTVPVNPTSYTLTCNGVDPITVSISQDHYPESVTLSSNGVNANSTTLTWSTVNASSCVASSAPATNWTGNVTNNGSQQNVNVPAGPDTIYSLTCTRDYPDNQSLCSLYPSDTTKICTSISLNEDSSAVSNTVQPSYIEN
jgi:hypothetical protein